MSERSEADSGNGAETAGPPKNGEQVQRPAIEVSPQRRQKKIEQRMYDIAEVDGVFEVVLPGAFDKEREQIIGTYRKRFDSQEEAAEAVAQSRENSRVAFEMASLEKTHPNSFYRTERTQDGKFKVVVPGLGDSSYFKFDTWDEAKAFFLKNRERNERLTKSPLLEIRTGEQETMAFSSLDAFDPKVAPAEIAYEIPKFVRKYLFGEGRLDGAAPSAMTYQETVKEKGWEKKLFSFVSDYLKAEGAATMKELGIKRLDALTPKQAVELATRLVIDLTKYDDSENMPAIPVGDTTIGEPKKTEADSSTAIQLLQEGRKRKGDPNWKGSGVCRNFASGVKAVFESLKESQTKFSQLRNTYSLYESGMDAFAPEVQDSRITKVGRIGHAWNTFITVSRKGEANTVIVDATWGKRDLDTRQINGVDHTLTRMEPAVHAIGQNLEQDAPDKNEQVQRLLAYYTAKIESPADAGAGTTASEKLTKEEQTYFRDTAVKVLGEKYDLSGVSDYHLVAYGQRFVAEVGAGKNKEKENRFFATRAVELLGKQGVPGKIPDALCEAIQTAYEKHAATADNSEIETLYKISRLNTDMDFRGILKKFLRGKEKVGNIEDSSLFTDNSLQVMAFEELKLFQGFDKILKEKMKFRVRMREVLPGLFMDFSPGTALEDAAELKFLASTTELRVHYIDTKNPSEEKARVFFEKARGSLRAMNPEKYEQIAAGLDDYRIVKDYKSLVAQLRA